MGNIILGNIIYKKKLTKIQWRTCAKQQKEIVSKKYIFFKKSLAMPINSMYTNPCCGMIAVKREVAGSQ